MTRNTILSVAGRAFASHGRHLAPGAIRNIATFYRNIINGRFDNLTVPKPWTTSSRPSWAAKPAPAAGK